MKLTTEKVNNGISENASTSLVNLIENEQKLNSKNKDIFVLNK